MAIRSKNKLLLCLATALLLMSTVILIRTAGALTKKNSDIITDYISQEEFGSLYIEDFLSKFSSKTITAADISDSQVESYRYSFGDFEGQVNDVIGQYRLEIERAQSAKNSDLEKELTEERQRKINDVIENFTDEKAVREKIATAKVDQILSLRDEVISHSTSTINSLNNNYLYYLTSSEGKVFQNISRRGQLPDLEIKRLLEKRGIGTVSPLKIGVAAPPELEEIWWNSNEPRVLKGYVTFVKGSEGADFFYDELRLINYGKVLFILGLIVMTVGGILLIFYMKLPLYDRTCHWLYKIPIDIRFLLSIWLTVIISFTVASLGKYLTTTDWRLAIAIFLIGYGSIILVSIIVKGVIFSLVKKEGYQTIKDQFNNSASYFLAKAASLFFKKLPTYIQVTVLVFGTLIVIPILYQFIYENSVGSLFRKITFWSLAIGLLIIVILLLTYRENKIRQVIEQVNKIMTIYQKKHHTKYALTEVITDLSELERMVSETVIMNERTEELKTELLTNVSHDLRTPLTSIISYGDLLTDQTLSNKERDEYLAIINKQSQRMKQLIDDLFEVTKMNNGNVTLHIKEINLQQLLRQTLGEYEEEMAEKQLHLITNFPNVATTIKVDGDKMWRVFDNLFGNVIKYGLPGTRVYLKVTEQVGTVMIQIKNISRYELNEEASSLVERFTRGDEARQSEGSGLGLAIINGIVTLHKGQLTIDVDGDMFKVTIILPK